MRFIAHFDIDAFYASVAVRDDPSLVGKPVAVAGSHRRAVVLTASYEARPFGVRSAIPLYRARQLCPQLVVVAPEMNKYKDVSRQVFAIFGARGHTVQGLSMDEAFVDLGEIAFDDAIRLTQQIRDEVFAETRLTVSAGVASGKLIAKIASDSCKPNGLLPIAPGEEASFLAPLAVGRLWGIGPKTAARLQTFGIMTIGQVAALGDASIKQLFGSWGTEVRDLARGVDTRPVEADRETKSISSEETFEYDVRDENQLIAALKEQTRDIVAKLDRENLTASTVGVKIKRADFRVFGRQTHLIEPTRDARRIFRAAVYCLRRADLNGAPVRLLGLRVASLTEGEAKQISLFEASTTAAQM